MIINFKVEFENLLDEKILDFLVNKMDTELSKLGVVFLQQGNFFCEGFVDFTNISNNQAELVDKIIETIRKIDNKIKIKNCG